MDEVNLRARLDEMLGSLVPRMAKVLRGRARLSRASVRRRIWPLHLRLASLPRRAEQNRTRRERTEERREKGRRRRRRRRRASANCRTSRTRVQPEAPGLPVIRAQLRTTWFASVRHGVPSAACVRRRILSQLNPPAPEAELGMWGRMQWAAVRLERTLAAMGMAMGRAVARFVAARTSKGERGWADDPETS